MPLFRAKKRCQYGGKIYEKNAVAEFFEPVSAQSWDAMDEEGKELLVYPENEKPIEDGNPEADGVLFSGEEFAELQGIYNALVDDFNNQQESFIALEHKYDAAAQSVSDLRAENDTLAKAAEGATAQQAAIQKLKQMVTDNENKSVLEEAITKL